MRKIQTRTVRTNRKRRSWTSSWRTSKRQWMAKVPRHACWWISEENTASNPLSSKSYRFL